MKIIYTPNHLIIVKYIILEILEEEVFLMIPTKKIIINIQAKNWLHQNNLRGIYLVNLMPDQLRLILINTFQEMIDLLQLKIEF